MRWTEEERFVATSSQIAEEHKQDTHTLERQGHEEGHWTQSGEDFITGVRVVEEAHSY